MIPAALRHPLRQVAYESPRHRGERPPPTPEERMRADLLRIAGVIHAADPGGEP